MSDALRQAEVAFYRSLNQFAEPLARSGALSPGLLPAGLVLVEVNGRKSGIVHPVPLVATALGDVLLVSTFRGRRSQWVKNLAAQPEVRYWLHGTAREGTAHVVDDTFGGPAIEAGGRAWLPGLVAHLRPWTVAGWAFAVIVPGAAEGAGEPATA